jgi:hypothetical protein
MYSRPHTSPSRTHFPFIFLTRFIEVVGKNRIAQPRCLLKARDVEANLSILQLGVRRCGDGPVLGLLPKQIRISVGMGRGLSLRSRGLLRTCGQFIGSVLALEYARN